jgi:hypothetical protein
MYRVNKNFFFMGTHFFVGDVVPDEMAPALGKRVDYLFNSEANVVEKVVAELPEKQIEEKPKRKYTPKKIEAENKAILRSRKNK